MELIKKIFEYCVKHQNYRWIFSGIGATVVGGLIIKFIICIIKIIVNFIKKMSQKHVVKTITFDKILKSLNRASKSKELFVDSDFDKIINIKQIMKEHFPEYKEFIVIRYGSSVMNDCVTPNDYDFIVLLLGYSQKHDLNILEIGNTEENYISDKPEIDIVFRDYMSFLFALVSGMPYEHSVALNGKIIQGHKGYFMWLKRIARNILIDRDFLIRRFENEKIPAEKIAWNNANQYSNKTYEKVRASYFYLCTLLQLKEIKGMQKVIFGKWVAELGNTKKLINNLKGEDKILFVSIIDALKRKSKIKFDDKKIQEVKKLLQKLSK